MHTELIHFAKQLSRKDCDHYVKKLVKGLDREPYEGNISGTEMVGIEIPSGRQVQHGNCSKENGQESFGTRGLKHQ